MEETVSFGSRAYLIFLGFLLFARGMDFLSTWIASPNLHLEANPIARFLGWKWGALINLVMCFSFAFVPLPSIVIITSSLLVAARNFQSASMMRTMGEENYSLWHAQRLANMSAGLYLFCLLAQTVLLLIIGVALMVFSYHLVPFGIGMGIIAYALAVSLFTILARWRRQTVYFE